MLYFYATHCSDSNMWEIAFRVADVQIGMWSLADLRSRHWKKKLSKFFRSQYLPYYWSVNSTLTSSKWWISKMAASFTELSDRRCLWELSSYGPNPHLHIKEGHSKRVPHQSFNFTDTGKANETFTLVWLAVIHLLQAATATD